MATDPNQIDLSAGLVPSSPPSFLENQPAQSTPPPIDLSAGLTSDAKSEPQTPAPDHGLMSTLKNAADKAEIGIGEMIPEALAAPLKHASDALIGPGALFGPETAGPSWHDVFHEPISQTLKKMKTAGHAALDSSLVVPNNALTPEFEASHPKTAAGIRGVGDAVRGLTTPSSIGLIVATEGISEIPGLVEKSFQAVPAAAPYAAKAVQASRAALAGLGAYFTEEQLRTAIKAVPEITQAIAVGDTSKAIELTTSALINAGFGLHGGVKTLQGARTLVNEAGTIKALQHEDLNKSVREHIKNNQVTLGREKALADLWLESVPDLSVRRKYPAYIEAGEDPDLLRQHQEETKAGPRPDDAIAAAQGEQVPLEDEVVPPSKGTMVYHGTGAPVEDISDLDAKYSSEHTTGGPAVYLTRSPEVASQYVSNISNARVLPGELSSKVKLFDAKAPLPQDILQQANLPEGASYLDAVNDFREANPKNSTPRIKALQKALANKGYHGVENIYSDRDMVGIFGDDVLPEGERFKDLIKSKFPGKTANGKPATVISASGREMQVPPERTTGEQKPPRTTEETSKVPESPEAAEHVLALQEALNEARRRAAQHVPTPEERARMVEEEDPDLVVTAQGQKALDYRNKAMAIVREEAEEAGVLQKGHERPNYVMHDLGYDDATNSAMQRLHDTMHAGQQAGLIYPNKDIAALDATAVKRLGMRTNRAKLATSLKAGRTNSGVPLVTSGGFIEGQHVSTEHPQDFEVSSADIAARKRAGNLYDLIKNGDIVANPDGSLRWNTSKFKRLNLEENRPLGPTPIPDRIVEEMKTSGDLAVLEKKGLIFQNADGKYFSTEHLYARTPLYAHPDVADYLNNVVLPEKAEATSAFGRIGQFYDDVTGNMKSLLLAWSPFHKVTEASRLMESLGIVKGAKTLVSPKPIDYFDLTPEQEAAIRDGIIVANPLGFSASLVKAGAQKGYEEGLSAGNENSWGGKTYRLFNKALEKLGVPDSIRNVINPQKILTENVFGPTGQITQAKFALYDKLKPEIAGVMHHDNPTWPDWKVDIEAGREAARFANNKFGGFNNVLAGRSLQDQKWLRRILLAPDFLETTGRSILDLASPYGKTLVTKLIQFNIAQALTAAAINYALHHKDGDHTVAGAVKAAHFDRPLAVVSPDGKTEYSIRTTIGDFMHFLNAPRDFVANRLNPMVKAIDENLEQRNQYGRRESATEAAEAFPKATLPINIQPFVGLGPGSVTEPNKTDMALKSLGISGRPVRSDAEALALQLVSQKMEGQPALTGPALVRQQLKFRAEDKLRDAYAIQDPAKKRAALEAARNDINTLVNQKMLDPEDRKKIMTAAQGSRLKSIFNTLTPADALHVWDLATPEEKHSLEITMQSKFARWMDTLGKRGLNINNLPADDQVIFNHFRQARTEAAQIDAERQKEQTASVNLSAGLSQPQARKMDASGPWSVVSQTPATPSIDLSAGLSNPNITDLANEAARKYGIDPNLVQQVIKQESAGDTHAVSNKNAVGLMQLEPGTAKQYGVKDSTDPAQNIDAGTHYLADLLHHYNGNVDLALAAYNAGPKKVDTLGRVPHIRETQKYVRDIKKNLGGR